MKTRTSARNRSSGRNSEGARKAGASTPAKASASGKARRAPSGPERKHSAARGRPAGANGDGPARARSGKRLAPPQTRPARNEQSGPLAGPEQAAPRVERVVVAEDRDGQRLDNFLASRLKGVPKSLIYRICRSGEVRINGGRAKPDQRVAAGDEIRIPPVRVAERGESGPAPATQLERIEAAIIHEDRDFLVIDKPAGVASHGGSGVSFGVIELLRAARPHDTLELVHRLDRDTSGVLVLARKRSALTALQAAIRAGQTEKHYLALLAGTLERSPWRVDAPLRKSVLQGGERMVRVDEEGKPSRSRFIELERLGAASLVEVALDTGRTHQIRVHAQHIGHPLAGDEKYGARGFNKAIRERGLRRLFLHAARFAFELGSRSFHFSAPLAPELAQVVTALQRQPLAMVAEDD